MPALNFLPLPRVSHPKPPGQTDGLPTLPGPWGVVALEVRGGAVSGVRAAGSDALTVTPAAGLATM